MSVHNLKTIPPYWEHVASGRKKFELRKNDRGFQVGDVLNLLEYIPETKTYTGNVFNVVVTYILDGFGEVIPDGYCILGIEPLEVRF